MDAEDKLSQIRKGKNTIQQKTSSIIHKPIRVKKKKSLDQVKTINNEHSKRRGRGSRQQTARITTSKRAKKPLIPRVDPTSIILPTPKKHIGKKFKGVVLTYLIGDYDNLPPLQKTSGWEYICVTNNNTIKNSNWKIVSLREEDDMLNDNKRKSSSIMFNVFNYLNKSYDIVITMDASMFINYDLNALSEECKINKYDAVFLSHPDRYCVYQEVKALLKTSKDIRNDVLKAKEHFEKENYPKNNGLFATGVIMLNGKSSLIKEYFANFRKDYINSFSRRDQLTINYSLYKNSKKLSKLNYKTIPFNKIIIYQHHVKNNTSIPFISYPHNYKKKIKHFKTESLNLKIYEHTPYNNEKDLVKAYNEFMELIPSNGWALFRDADTLFLDYHYNELFENAIVDNPDTFCFTCVTNRLNNKKQVYDEYKGDDIKIHREIAIKLRKKYGHSCETLPLPPTLGGFCILLKKSVWKKIGGFKYWNNRSKILGVDNKLHEDLGKHNEPIKIIKGLYMYHWYRGGDYKNKTHLL